MSVTCAWITDDFYVNVHFIYVNMTVEEHEELISKHWHWNVEAWNCRQVKFAESCTKSHMLPWNRLHPILRCFSTSKENTPNLCNFSSGLEVFIFLCGPVIPGLGADLCSIITVELTPCLCKDTEANPELSG